MILIYFVHENISLFQPTFYIVTNYLTGLHLHSELDNKNITYREHFENTYKISPLQPGQPLMEVRTVTKNFDSIKPRLECHCNVR